MSSPTSKDDIRVVVSIDFGTTFSGYAYAHKFNPNDITVEDQWDGLASFKIPTIIKYKDKSCSTIKSWGPSALAKRRNTDQSKPIELFKLYLLKEPSMKLPPLPVDYKKVITDYLKQLSKMIKENVNNIWDLDFYSQVLIVLTIPTEFADDEIEIMRDCAYKAGLMKEKNSRFLIFITEPEAAAVNCLNASVEVKKLKPGELFMIVDCGGGTVDLTCHELLSNNRISEATESKGGNCGSSFVDENFKEFLRNKLGEPTFELLENEYYNALQYMVQEFCENVKIPFTGKNFKPYKIDLEDYFTKYPSTLRDIVKEGKEKELLEESEWMITLQLDDVKKMFDPLITRIIQLIKGQLDQLQNKNKRCSAMILVGGFSESEYLQNIIKSVFKNMVISFPPMPVVAVLKGGVQFGLEVETVAKRVLKRTYGTNVVRRSQLNDPQSEMLPNGDTIVFEPLASRGDVIPVNDKVVQQFRLSSLTKRVNFNMYVTKKIDAKFCNDPEVSLLRHLEVELPESDESDESDDDDDDDDDYDDTIISLTLTFGTVEISATAKNQKTGETYRINQKPRAKLQYE